MKYRPLALRFHEKVDLRGDDECWPWKAFLTPTGYGMIWNGKRMVPAHRIAYELHHFVEVPEGKVVCHKCDNRACVNPAHLFLGTQQDNIADMKAKGRARGVSRPGELSPSSKLTEGQAWEIKCRLRAGESQRSLAKEYGVAQPTISNLMTGSTWSHLQ